MIDHLNLTRDELVFLLPYWMNNSTLGVYGLVTFNDKDIWMRHYDDGLVYDYSGRTDDEDVSMHVVLSVPYTGVLLLDNAIRKYEILKICYVSSDVFYTRTIQVIK